MSLNVKQIVEEIEYKGLTTEDLCVPSLNIKHYLKTGEIIFRK